MKHIILTISLILSATTVSAASHSKEHELPKKTAKKYTKELGDYLKKQIKNGLILKRTLRILLMHLNMQLRYNGMLVLLQTIRLFLKPFAIKINSEGSVTFIEHYALFLFRFKLRVLALR